MRAGIPTVATFRPKRVETLKPHMFSLIGHRGNWECAGQIDQGQFAGQLIYYLSRKDPKYDETLAAWVPEEDLVDMQTTACG